MHAIASTFARASVAHAQDRGAGTARSWRQRHGPVGPQGTYIWPGWSSVIAPRSLSWQHALGAGGHSLTLAAIVQQYGMFQIVTPPMLLSVAKRF